MSAVYRWLLRKVPDQMVIAEAKRIRRRARRLRDARRGGA